MRFVSQHAALRLHIRPEERKLIFNPHTGEPREVLTRQMLVAEFRFGDVRPSEAAAARAMFEGRMTAGDDTWISVGDLIGGSSPKPYGEPMVDPATGRVMDETVGFTPEMRYSLFDTEWITDPEDRALAEEVMVSGSAGHGITHVLVGQVRISPPWPSYDAQRDVAGAHNKIPSLCKDLGIDPRGVLAYEHQQAEPKAGIVAALEALIVERQREAGIDQSLEAVV